MLIIARKTTNLIAVGKVMSDMRDYSTKSLIDVLKSFDGAQGSKIHLKAQFKEIAKHLLHGGYFLVSGAGVEPYRVYLHTIEFYYHEEHAEGPKYEDLIVYHRNSKNRAPKPAFRIGTLNAHQSGIDITFEDNSNLEDPAYRASALIRCFKVKDLKDEKWGDREFDKPKYKTCPTVEAYPLHLYEYLFMQQVLTDVCVKWVDIPVTKGAIHTGPRINVFKYDDSGKSDKKKPDLRKRAYSIETFK